MCNGDRDRPIILLDVIYPLAVGTSLSSVLQAGNENNWVLFSQFSWHHSDPSLARANRPMEELKGYLDMNALVSIQPSKWRSH